MRSSSSPRHVCRLACCIWRAFAVPCLQCICIFSSTPQLVTSITIMGEKWEQRRQQNQPMDWTRWERGQHRSVQDHIVLTECLPPIVRFVREIYENFMGSCRENGIQRKLIPIRVDSDSKVVVIRRRILLALILRLHWVTNFKQLHNACHYRVHSVFHMLPERMAYPKECVCDAPFRLAIGWRLTPNALTHWCP